ncbi:endospore germination permease [Paenibacillus sp. BC26]|uniref:GerAB/ArcD/ProY family transporter n=1 Tax=Paenibacillus sp. BC26 TaxID=1881032 RepID=UPI0008E44E62|nr:endospore germination permease [Paenibacillus sp. BC26]SFS63100.1 spore germination protein (amino acid permease) [Paenibacillus sp. BC26]
MKVQPREQITATQLGFLLITFVISTIILTVPGIMVMFGKQNSWMSFFPACLTGLLSIWVMITLGKRYPGLTITQYSSKIVGKWLGALLGINYIYYWFISITTITMQHVGFVSTLLLPQSPHIVGSLTFLILCAIAVLTGIEVIARCNELISMIILVSLLPLLILTASIGDFNQLKPVLGDGVVPVLQGAVSPAGGFMNQLFILGWLYPYLNQPHKARKVSLIALTCIFVIIVAIVLLTITVLGPLTGKLTYSFLSVIQYIGITGSFERLEAVAVSIWVMGCFVKVAICLFILCLCVCHLFGMRNYREFVLPVTMMSLVGSVWIFKNGSELLNYLAFTFPLLAFFNQSFLPLLLLAIDSIKRRGRHSLL